MQVTNSSSTVGPNSFRPKSVLRFHSVLGPTRDCNQSFCDSNPPHVCPKISFCPGPAPRLQSAPTPAQRCLLDKTNVLSKNIVFWRRLPKLLFTQVYTSPHKSQALRSNHSSFERRLKRLKGLIGFLLLLALSASSSLELRKNSSSKRSASCSSFDSLIAFDRLIIF